jgi:hypothetical protein
VLRSGTGQRDGQQHQRNKQKRERNMPGPSLAFGGNALEHGQVGKTQHLTPPSPLHPDIPRGQPRHQDQQQQPPWAGQPCQAHTTSLPAPRAACCEGHRVGPPNPTRHPALGVAPPTSRHHAVLRSPQISVHNRAAAPAISSSFIPRSKSQRREKTDPLGLGPDKKGAARPRRCWSKADERTSVHSG